MRRSKIFSGLLIACVLAGGAVDAAGQTLQPPAAVPPPPMVPRAQPPIIGLPPGTRPPPPHVPLKGFELPTGRLMPGAVSYMGVYYVYLDRVVKAENTVDVWFFVDYAERSKIFGYEEVMRVQIDCAKYTTKRLWGEVYFHNAPKFNQPEEGSQKFGENKPMTYVGGSLCLGPLHPPADHIIVGYVDAEKTTPKLSGPLAVPPQ